jgi:hypothetical protein
MKYIFFLTALAHILFIYISHILFLSMFFHSRRIRRICVLVVERSHLYGFRNGKSYEWQYHKYFRERFKLLSLAHIEVEYFSCICAIIHVTWAHKKYTGKGFNFYLCKLETLCMKFYPLSFSMKKGWKIPPLTIFFLESLLIFYDASLKIKMFPRHSMCVRMRITFHNVDY